MRTGLVSAAAALLVTVATLLPGVAENSGAPLIYVDEEIERPAVTETGSVVTISAPGGDSVAGTPAGMAAARLAAHDRIFQWTPSPARRATGGADLVGAALSPDESLLVLAERVGGEGELNSTRLILINLLNGKIANILEIRERRLGEIIFPPGGDAVVAIQYAQPEFDHPAGLVLIDLRSGGIRSESAPMPEAPRSLSSNGESVWYTLPGEDEYFFELKLSNLAGEALSRRTRATVPRLLLDGGGRDLVVYGRGRCEYYRLEANGATYDGGIALPEEFSPEWAAVTTLPGGRNIVFGEADGPAFLIGGGGALRIADKSGVQSCCLPSDGTLLLAIEARDALVPYALPNTAPGREIIPGRIKPVNRNRIWRLIPRSGAEDNLVLVDIRGNVFTLTVDERRPKKNPVLIVDRTGIK